MSLRVVIDTNITVSALLFGGVPLKVVEAAFSRRFVWVISEPLLVELDRALGSPKFALSAREKATLSAPILDVVEIVVPTTHLEVIERCPADNRVLECAVDGGCERIVTGDRRDLLGLKSYQAVRIVTARTFVNELA
ncbi:MAG: putative toxin-antitoxin system toxin component, PIN family [Deltaproteobacteria bacterium]|nr:putative toxin-antitoxin system toxin component, PIN family [Deltaproteobacteria bacterium]